MVSKIRKKKLVIRFTGDSAWERAFNQDKIKDDIITFQKKRYSLKIEVRKFLRKQILKGAALIITDCNFLKNLATTIGIAPAKVRVINNAVSALPLLSFDRQEFKKMSHLGEPVILTMGRLVPWKGIDALIKIIPSLLEQFPAATLLIVGEGPQEMELKKLAGELNVADHVIFFGPLKSKIEKKKIYATADIFVLHTFYEGMSNTLLEAMAASKPIITTRAGGNPEFINQSNGVLIDYNNEEQLTNAILYLLTNKELARELGQQARQTASQFTWQKLVAKNVDTIKSLL